MMPSEVYMRCCRKKLAEDLIFNTIKRARYQEQEALFSDRPPCLQHLAADGCRVGRGSNSLASRWCLFQEKGLDNCPRSPTWEKSQIKTATNGFYLVV